MATRLLPLFPLSVVLLPATPLPLHIFEDRYKQMMGDVIPANEPFGVVLAKEEGVLNIGCSATVQKILERYRDGRLDLIALGQRPFRIVSLDKEKPYLRCEAEFFDDLDDSTPSSDLRLRAFTACEKLRSVESPNVIVEPELDSPHLSFQLGQFVSDLDKRQALLSIESEVDRLEYLVSLLPQYTIERQQIALARRVAPQNGHAKHVNNL